MSSIDTIFSSDLLRGKTVFVSGGGSGIGRATAWLSVRLGATVVVGGRSEEKLAATVEAVKRITSSDKMSYCVMDIRDPVSVARALGNVYDSLGSLDVLVNSAGGQFPQAAIKYSEKGWRSIVETNLNGTWNMMDYVAKRWQQAGTGGSVVNVVVVGQGLHGVAHTVAARAGVIAFSEKAAVEWAPFGVRVNCVAPGAIKTEGWNVYPKSAQSRYPKTNPMMRAGSSWEVAEAIIFVGGPGGRFINGETLVIDGGGRHWGEIWTEEKPEYFRKASREYEDQSGSS